MSEPNSGEAFYIERNNIWQITEVRFLTGEGSYKYGKREKQWILRCWIIIEGIIVNSYIETLCVCVYSSAHGEGKGTVIPHGREQA